MRKEILRMEHVTYKEEDKVLLQDFDLNVFEGEVMGLLPMGAYGLPAFLHILAEYPPLYHGYIYYREKLVDSWLEDKNSRNRVSMIGDKSSLVEGQTVLTNVMILRRGFRQEVLQIALLKKQLQRFLDEMGLRIDPQLPVEKLTPFERIQIEILRAVVADHRLIVMQEISTIIGESEMNRLHEIIRRYTKKGFAFLYISPHFEELQQICDRTAVMTDKRVSKILCGEEMTANVINRCTTEYITRVQERISQRKECSNRVVFSAEGVTGTYLNHLNFQVREGECLAVQCLDPKISKELFLFLLGKKEILSGEVFLEGKSLDKKRMREMAVIMEHPWESMIFPHMSVLDNLRICMDHRVPEVWNSKSIQRSLQKTLAEQMGENVAEKKISDLTDPQKSELVYMRVLLQKPRIVFCIQPFKGEDLSHRIRIWELQKKLLDRGTAVVIMAVNMADALSIADRVIRIDKYTHVSEYERQDFGRLPSTVPWYSLYRGED